MGGRNPIEAGKCATAASCRMHKYMERERQQGRLNLSRVALGTVTGNMQNFVPTHGRYRKEKAGVVAHIHDPNLEVIL